MIVISLRSGFHHKGVHMFIFHMILFVRVYSDGLIRPFTLLTLKLDLHSNICGCGIWKNQCPSLFNN